jgi:hypothetical protein
MQRSVRNPLFRRGPSRHSFDPSPQAYPGKMTWDYDRIEIIACVHSLLLENCCD